MSSSNDHNNQHLSGENGGGSHDSLQHHQYPPRPPPAPGSQPDHHSHPQPGQHPSQDNQAVSDSNKRAALAGQWRTPPLPVFPTSASSNQPPPQHHPYPPQPPPPVTHAPQTQPTPQADIPAPTTLPDNSEDYAKALQEAYRRGAEAAAAMAAQQQHISPSASCPNFQMPMAPAPPSQHSHGQTIMASRSEDMTSSSTSYAPPPPPPHSHPAYHPQYAEHPVVPHHGHNPPEYHTPHPPPPHPHQQHPQHPPPPPPPPHQYAQPPPSYVAPAPTTSAPPAPAAPAPQTVPNPLSNMPPPPNKQPQQQPIPPAPPGATQVVVPPPQQRSVSLPDMTSYAVQAEEEKRQKRLARNRASARLRRLRKKNLVDAYETEVGILEKTLQHLKAHEWGVPTNAPAGSGDSEKSHQSLLEALCMDRGQQVISSEQRAQQCQDILEQQLQQMELLRQVQFEQQLLAAASSNEYKDQDPELAEMSQELNEVLGLSDAQKAQLQENSRGLDEEMTALETVFSSLVMMKENEWLLNQGVQDITDQLTSILHKNQMSKFLLWADANVEAIDQLDHVHAAPKSDEHPQGPMFVFGVETTPMEDEGDGK